MLDCTINLCQTEILAQHVKENNVPVTQPRQVDIICHVFGNEDWITVHSTYLIHIYINKTEERCKPSIHKNECIISYEGFENQI